MRGWLGFTAPPADNWNPNGNSFLCDFVNCFWPKLGLGYEGVNLIYVMMKHGISLGKDEAFCIFKFAILKDYSTDFYYFNFKNYAIIPLPIDDVRVMNLFAEMLDIFEYRPVTSVSSFCQSELIDMKGMSVKDFLEIPVCKNLFLKKPKDPTRKHYYRDEK